MRIRSANGKLSASLIGKHVLLIALSFLAVFPLYWMIITSLKSDGEIFSSSLLPHHWTFENYRMAWDAIPMARMLGNSIGVSLLQTVCQLFTSVLAAYAFTRWDFRGSSLIYGIIGLTWLVPFQVIMIPNYVAISEFGWRDTLTGLIVPNIVSAFAVMQLYNAFKGFPKALIEAARLDGAGDWSISIGVSLLQTVCQLFTSVLAAYAFTRWDFRGSSLIYGIIGLTWLVPFQVIMIPNYVAISEFGWRDTLTGLIVPNIVSAFAVMQLYNAFKGFPKALIEAARLDGAGDWSILWRTVYPNLKASIASIGILLFITSWNDYFWPLLVTTKMEHSTIQKGLQMFISSESNLWGELMAATTIASLPVLILYLLLQRQIIDSFVKGGLR
ncbi:ABC transporter permease subunit [Cohnella sp. AR92]|uniref:ABC transporter permease subunit n=1 Tax=Cohnella sp. AR92 TaxID=648716 RepID=UPI000F8DE97B|nr:ABC transporter permease subunit [Cohnella sp. AR92]RUS45319.1 ABC transporter permease subunit [Cohnella sp. AR92]